MKNLKPVLWIVVGILIGAASALTANQTPLKPTKPEPSQRLEVTSAGKALNN